MLQNNILTLRLSDVDVARINEKLKREKRTDPNSSISILNRAYELLMIWAKN